MRFETDLKPVGGAEYKGKVLTFSAVIQNLTAAFGNNLTL